MNYKRDRLTEIRSREALSLSGATCFEDKLARRVKAQLLPP